MRVGQGFDAHRFGAGDHVVLGGVRIPHSQGLIAHSDGDVLLHAVCDAVLGAAGLGDIGQQFPDTDAQWKDADSRQLLRNCVALAAERGWRLSNLDATVIASAPRLAPHTLAMRTHLAADMLIDSDAVGIKATTTEGMGFTGRGEGIAAMAVVLLERI